MMKRLFQQVQNSRKLLLISILFGCIGGVVLIAESYYVADIVNRVFLQGATLANVKLLLMILLAIIVLRGLLHMLSDYTSAKLAQGIKGDLRLRLIDKLSQLGPHYSKGERSGELVSTIYEGVEQLENYLAKYVPQIALSMFVPFAVFIVVVGQDGLSALVYAITLPLLIIFMILIGKFTKARTDRQYKLLGRLGGHFQEVLRGIETLKMFNRSKDQLKIIGNISEQHRISTMATLRLAFLSAFVMELFATLSTAIIAVFLGLRLIEGKIEFYHAFLILLLTPEFYAPIRALGTQFHSGMNGASAATRIFQIFDAEPQGLVEQADAIKVQRMWPAGHNIRFDSVSLQHKGYSTPALDRISFTLEAGETLAIVGATGAGKSSILDLLQGFIKPTSGTIYVNGIPLEQLSMEHWRKQLTTVSQSVHLFHGTIRENITLGLEDATDEMIWNALRQAAAHSFVAQLPQGLETVLTDNIILSGGQKQRLVLARAMLKRDASVVLLDEATNGLDVHNEVLVTRNIEEWITGKTAIIVAHHLQTIAKVDKVIVLHEGKIVEAGSPQQLASSNGKFSSMLSAMNAGRQSVTATAMTGQSHSSSVRKTVTLMSEKAENSTAVVEAVTPEQEQVIINDEKLDERSSFSFQLFWQTSRRLMKFLGQHKLIVFAAVLLSFLTIAANIGLMGTSGYLIAKAALQPENVLMLYVPIVGVRFFGISRGVLRYLERLASHNATFKVLHRLRVWLYEKIEPRGAALLQRKRGGNLLSTIISDIDQLQNYYLRLFAPPIVYSLTVVLAVCFIGWQHYSLGIALLIMLLVAGILLPYGSYKVSKHSGSRLVQTRTKLYEESLDLLRGLSTLQQYGRLAQQQQLIAEEQNKLNVLQILEHRRQAISNGLMTMVTQLGMWVLLLIAIPLVVDGSIAPYMLPAILLMALASFEAAAPLPQAFAMSSTITASANRLFQLADEQEQVANSKLGQQVERADESVVGLTESSASIETNHSLLNWSCEVNNIAVRYEGAQQKALEKISLSLQRGKQIAVVGESGAGKSTLIQALLKLQPIQQGSIALNGQRYEQLTEEQVRSQFAVVSQQVQLFNASVADNLRLGNREASDEQIREAARLAEIDEFIMSLPQGYQTMIGEYGAKLSGGQRQRLALARALLKPSPALLLDEPATGLDHLTQVAFRSNIKQELEKRATLWITHRLIDTVEMDEIIVLKHGVVVEQGTHQQLLAANGYYAQLWRLERGRDWAPK